MQTGDSILGREVWERMPGQAQGGNPSSVCNFCLPQGAPPEDLEVSLSLSCLRLTWACPGHLLQSSQAPLPSLAAFPAPLSHPRPLWLAPTS